ncbi:MAG: hypothetical protein ACLR7Z_00630 [Bilophila wadsworthia]
MLDDPARCLEEVACSGNMDEIAAHAGSGFRHQPEPRLFEEAERDG